MPPPERGSASLGAADRLVRGYPRLFCVSSTTNPRLANQGSTKSGHAGRTAIGPPSRPPVSAGPPTRRPESLEAWSCHPLAHRRHPLPAFASEDSGTAVPPASFWKELSNGTNPDFPEQSPEF